MQLGGSGDPGWGDPRRRTLLRGRSGRFRVWPLVIFGAFFAWYYFSHQEEVPLTGRKQLVDLSREQEAALGLESYRQILGQSQIVAGGADVDRIRAIGRRLAAVSDDPGFEWEFNLIASDQANAFALPGGKVAVYSGLLPIAGNDDGLAAVMGHEIAHAIARHGAERIAHEKLAQLGSLAVGTAVGEMDVQTQRMVMGALGVGAQFGVLLPFSRSHETEADYMGLIYTARACFDPREAPRLWERMSRAAGGGAAPAEFMSTHPGHETRIQNLDQWMAEAMRVRAESCGGAGGTSADAAQ
ncbi:MAG TPA: M48 family metallopeptidase [Myxococcota bacterium]|jgi:predicted Zn-dependent protease